MSNIDDAISAATAAAEAAPPPVAPVAAAQNATGTAVAPAAPAPGVPVTMDSLMKATIQADHWLKVNEYGLFIGKSKEAIDSIVVDIDMVDCRAGFGLRAGNPPRYWKTYDKSVGINGEAWTECFRQARIIDDGVREYPLADIVMTLVDDVKGKKDVLAQAGETLAHTTSVTNWKNWSNFYRALQKLGKHEENVRVKLSSEERNGNGNTWGVIQFELVE